MILEICSVLFTIGASYLVWWIIPKYFHDITTVNTTSATPPPKRDGRTVTRWVNGTKKTMKIY